MSPWNQELILLSRAKYPLCCNIRHWLKKVTQVRRSTTTNATRNQSTDALGLTLENSCGISFIGFQSASVSFIGFLQLVTVRPSCFRNPLLSLHKLTLLFHDCNQSAAS